MGGMEAKDARTMPELLEIVGQDAAVARLQQAMGGERMAHAFLFAGPAGVGRRTTAIALGRTLLCERPAEAPNNGRFEGLSKDAALRQACGACRSCKLVAAGSHPDFHLVYKELARFHDDSEVRNRVMQGLGIPVIRSFLIAPAARSAGLGRGKVFVVLEAELMSAPAQNALLKTLEEPPPDVTILLIARRAEELLPTTLSRCALIRFALLPRDFVAERLIASGVGRQEARFWADYTEGAIGTALRLAEQGMYSVKTDILGRIAALDAGGDAELGGYLAKTTDTLADAAVKEVKQQDDAELSRNLAIRQAVGTMLELLASAFRDALTLATRANRPLTHADQQDAIERLAGRFDPTGLAEIIDQLGEYERLLWRNANAKIIWDNVVITCASAAPLRV